MARADRPHPRKVNVAVDLRSTRRANVAVDLRSTEIIAGIHAVEEALIAGESIQRILIGSKRARDPQLGEIVKRAREKNVPVAFEPEEAFRRFGDLRHQHVVAMAKPFAYAPWEEVLAAVRADQNALVVALDHLEDPQNLGAVIRNAEASGAVAVVIPDRRSAAVTPATRRAAAGAASHIAVASVPNLVRALQDLKAGGCWVYGLSTATGAVPYTQIDFKGRVALVVGAEGKGLSRLVAEHCDRLAHIPLYGKVSSLNASSSAAIALFEALRQRQQAEIVTPKNKPQSLVNP